MAWKFEKDSVRDGDVVEPTETRKNINEFLGEINGYLDSDNLAKSSITVDTVKRHALTQVLFNQQSPRIIYVFDHNQSGWVDRTKCRLSDEYSGDTNRIIPGEARLIPPYMDGIYFDVERTFSTTFYLEDKFLPTIEFDANEEGLITVEFTGQVQWMPQVSNGTTKITRYGNSLRYAPGEYARVIEEGDLLSEAFAEKHGTTWRSPGTSFLYPGAYAYFKIMDNDFKNHQAFILCSMWRITVNGMSVAETGPLGNEYSCHPISLVGSIPVEGGKNNIIKVESQFVWYSPGLDQYKSSSSSEATLFGQHDDAGETEANNDGPSARLDCSLYNQNLFATYRKR